MKGDPAGGKTTFAKQLLCLSDNNSWSKDFFLRKPLELAWLSLCVSLCFYCFVLFVVIQSMCSWLLDFFWFLFVNLWVLRVHFIVLDNVQRFLIGFRGVSFLSLMFFML